MERGASPATLVLCSADFERSQDFEFGDLRVA
jgi:hypothetical protein